MPVTNSADGTSIAYSVTGTGPLVVLVDGAMCHRSLGPAPKLAPLLSPRFTVVTYDRRGRGESGNTAPYAVERELEDLDAVLSAVGPSAMVLGMSSGAALALRAVAAGLPATRLALFEPPFVAADGPHAVPPADAHQVLSGLVASGAHGEAITYFLTRIFGMPKAAVRMFGLFRSMWNKTKATAPSLPHEITIMGDWQPPTELLGGLTVPTLAICGEKSPVKLRAAYTAVRAANPRIAGTELARQGHNASMKVLAPVVTEFFSHTRIDQEGIR
jgi:pimeloyl-ACP methyl ester carboxylesterase